MRLIVSLPLSLAAGLAMGHAVFRTPAPSAAATVAATHAEESSPDASALPDAPGTTEAKVQRLVTMMLGKGNRSERENEMYLAIEALTAEDFRRLLVAPGPLKAMAEMTHDIDGETTGPLASALIARWLAVDGGATATWAPRLLRSEQR